MTDAELPGDSAGGSPDGGQEEAHEEPRPEDWQDSEALEYSETTAHEMAGYASVVQRIQWMIVVAGVLCSAVVIWPFGWVPAAGVLLGTLLGWINFRWLADSINAIGERIVKIKSQERGAAVVARGVGRIFLIALVAYVIFTYSVRGLVGFLAGLAMPVIAMMCEAVYEFVASNRRSS
jgi:hypothetical protein